MLRETAYKLAGRHHHHPAPGGGLLKRRVLRLHPRCPGGREQAVAVLEALGSVSVEQGQGASELLVIYSVLDHTMQGLEAGLRAEGLLLDERLHWQIARWLVHFSEETQRRNLRSPERLLKQSHKVYVHAWEHHPHGDHDNTPPELRGYK